MAVKRIVTNIAAEQLGLAQTFYSDVLGMRVVMDLGWILTFAADGSAAPQLSVASEGGSGTPVPEQGCSTLLTDSQREYCVETTECGGVSVLIECIVLIAS
jgi:catechol 2,3-dioxygenase-like lactoylglutathione lyase family enzyme